MLLATSTYWGVPAGCQPVRASRGVPERWAQVPACWPAAPSAALLHHWSPDAYLRLLEDRMDGLLARVEALLVQHERISLCCFEHDPADCHRSVLGEWLRGHGFPVVIL